MSISVDIKKNFPDFTLDVSFSSERERLALLGESGCGKSMTLKCIAGIETPDTGTIIIDGETVFDSEKKINLSPQLRNVGLLFQHYGLFPTMTVEKNIAIALKKKTKEGGAERVEELLEKMRLTGLGRRYPSQLSGGQRQRVALARMIASDPRIIMLDEPFSALDSFLRSHMENELLESLDGYPGSVIYVSHDRDEAYRFCEKIIILQNGKIAGEGSREDIFENPRTVASARLTGCKNIAPAIKISDHRIQVPSWGLFLKTKATVPDSITHAGIRSHHLRIPHRKELVNCFVFLSGPERNDPFTVTKFIKASQGAEALRWDMSVSDIKKSENNGPQASIVCVPSEHIILLS